MNTILFVTGPRGVGKTTFIEKHFAKREGYYVFDLCRISDQLFGTTLAFDDDRLADVYNQSTEEAMDALMEDKVLIVEYCLSGYDDDFVALVKSAKSNGFRVEINQITGDRKSVSASSMQIKRVDICLPFDRIRDHLLEILAGIIECIGYNCNWERVCHLSGQGVSIDFFKAEQDGRTSYFFITEEKKYFVFDEGREDGNLRDIAVVQQYPSFQGALEGLQQRIPLVGLYPSYIKDGYLKTFKNAYQPYISKALTTPAQNWEIFQN